MTTPAEIEAQKLVIKQQEQIQPTAAVVGTVVSGPGAAMQATTRGSHPHSAYLQPIHDLRATQQLPPDQWHSGLCDCFQDMDSCCESMWCEYCTMGHIYGKVKTGRLEPDWAICCGTYCADALFLMGGARCFMVWNNRNNVRQRFNIDPEGNDCAEGCKSFWCSQCAQCQTHRELTVRGYWPGSMFCINPNEKLLQSVPLMQ